MEAVLEKYAQMGTIFCPGGRMSAYAVMPKSRLAKITDVKIFFILCGLKDLSSF